MSKLSFIYGRRITRVLNNVFSSTIEYVKYRVRQIILCIINQDALENGVCYCEILLLCLSRECK